MTEDLQNHRLDKIEKQLDDMQDLMVKLSDRRKGEVEKLSGKLDTDHSNLDSRVRHIESEIAILRGQLRVWQYIVGVVIAAFAALSGVLIHWLTNVGV